MALPVDQSGGPIPVNIVAGIDQSGNPQALATDAAGSLQERQLRELLTLILMELRGMRLAIVSMATESGQADETDFDPAYLDSTFIP